MHKIITLLILTLFLLISCSSYQHVSNSPYVPLHEKEGELKANISFNSVKLSYSFFENVSFFAEYFHRTNESTIRGFLASENGGRVTSLSEISEKNAGLIFFNQLGKFKGEVLMGGGIGDFKYEYNEDERLIYDYDFRVNSKKMNFFIQPNFGYKYEDRNFHSEIAVYSKVYLARHKDIRVYYSNLTSRPILKEHEIFLNKNDINFYFIEPGLLIRSGFKYVTLQVLYSPKIFCNNRYLNYKDYNINLSLNLNLELFSIK